jgi:hypothetical protein
MITVTIYTLFVHIITIQRRKNKKAFAGAKAKPTENPSFRTPSPKLVQMNQLASKTIGFFF